MSADNNPGLTPGQIRGKWITTAILGTVVIGMMLVSYFTRGVIQDALYKDQDGHNKNKPGMGAYH
ncbi:MAG: hypothetical protein H7338_05485 [Candidatus Sericytochromatia bacterium]|nr:hypothetical protein [Candidatus Sericytochromatia bacterium]